MNAREDKDLEAEPTDRVDAWSEQNSDCTARDDWCAA